MRREPVYSGDEGEYVTIRTKVYKELIEDQRMMITLQNAGVDSWEGYDLAVAAYADNKDFEESR